MKPTLRFFFLAWTIALVTHSSGLYWPMHADWSARLRVAREWAAGARLYEETFENNQPTIYLYLRLVDSPWPPASMYLAETLLAAAAAVAFRRALVSWIPRAANWTPLLLVAWTGTSPSFYGGQINEALAGWCDVLTVSFLTLAAVRGSWRLAFMAGLFAFFTFSLRIPTVAHLAAYAVLAAMSGRRLEAGGRSREEGGRRREAGGRRFRGVGLRFVVPFLAGIACGGAAVFAHAKWLGYWDGLVQAFWLNVAYGDVGRLPWTDSLLTVARRLARLAVLPNLPATLLASYSIASCLAPTKSPRIPKSQIPNPKSRLWPWVLAIVWIAAVVASAWPGGRHYLHYYHAIWAPVSLIAGLGLARLRSVTRARVATAALAIAMATSVYGIGRSLWEVREGTHPSLTIREAVDYLDSTIPPNDTVLANLWLDQAELYWRSPRPAVGLSIPHLLPRTWFAEWVGEIVRTPPDWYVTDNTPWGGFNGPADPGDVARLERFLGEQYLEVRRIGGLSIRKRIQ